MGEIKDIARTNQLSKVRAVLLELPSSFISKMNPLEFIKSNQISQKVMAERSEIDYVRIRNLINNPKNKLHPEEEAALNKAIQGYLIKLFTDFLK